MLRIMALFPLLSCTAFASVISGHVVGPDGQPAAGAKMWLWQESGTQHTTTTDVGGYSFTKVDVGPIQLVALKDGLAIGGASRFVVGDGQEDIALAEAAEIHLKVGAPGALGALAGARVASMMVNNTFVVPVEELVAEGFPEWRSGDDGTVTITNMPLNGFVKLSLKHVDYADTYVDFVPVRERVTAVAMDVGVKVHGRVTDGKKPIAKARVTVFQVGTGGQREYGRATSDGDGLFTVRLAVGEYLAAARQQDWASPPPLTLSVVGTDDIDAGDITLLAPYRLRGSVVMPDGTPCPGARVTYREKNTIYDDTFTGGDGAFTIKAASPKGTLRIGAPTGYKTEILSDIKVDLGDAREAKIEAIKLRKLPAIEGAVTMEDGTPGANVLVASLNLPQAIWMLTDAEGKFFFQLMGDADVEEVSLLAEHREHFQRAEFTYSLKDPKPAAVKLAAYSPNEVQPDVPSGTNVLGAILDQKAPEIKCSKWVNGGPVTLDSLKGKVAVVLFWAGFDTTIEGVNKVEQTRALMALYKDDPQVTFFALHDCTSEAAEVEEFVKRAQLTCPVGLDSDPMVTFGAFHVNFIPEVVLLDKSGNIRYFQPGPRIVEFIKALRRRAK